MSNHLIPALKKKVGDTVCMQSVTKQLCTFVRARFPRKCEGFQANTRRLKVTVPFRRAKGKIRLRRARGEGIQEEEQKKEEERGRSTEDSFHFWTLLKGT